MVDHITDSKANIAALSSSAALGAEILAQQTHMNNRVMHEDTVAEAKKGVKIEAKGPAKGASLPEPNSAPPSGDRLEALYIAFAAAFNANAEATSGQGKQLVKLQNLNLDLSSISLASTKLAISKEEENAKTSEALTKKGDKAKTTAEVAKVFGYVGAAAGALLILGTFISGFFTGGATDAAIPAEVELEGALVGAGEGAAEGAEEGAVDGAAIGGEAAAEAPGELAEEVDEGAELEENIGENENAQNNRSIKDRLKDWWNSRGSNTGKSRVGKLMGNKWTQRGISTVLSTAFAFPMFISGVAKTKVAKQYKQLAKNQEGMAGPMAAMQQNKTYLDNFGEILSRDGTFTQDLPQGLSDIVTTFGAITKSYGEIAVGLSRAAAA